jgi:protein transport protein SEC20
LTSQKSDTWYLETAFYILLATIAWLVWRRLLYGPTWWILWFLPRMFFRGCFGILTFMGVIGGQKTDVGVSSVAGGETVVHSSGTRGPKVAMAGQKAPSIQVGGGGKGGPVKATGTPQGNPHEASGDSVSEKVSKIIDESGDAPIEDEGAGSEKGASDEAVKREEVESQPNPKKRMWEEGKESATKAERKKDEL